MEIKDIVDQEKQRELARKSQLKQDKHIKTLFLKDCYKMWKDYKKVEKPYTWWLGILFGRYSLFGKFNYAYSFWELPKSYLEDSWFNCKWDMEYCKLRDVFKIKHKTNPNNDYIYLD